MKKKRGKHRKRIKIRHHRSYHKGYHKGEEILKFSIIVVLFLIVLLSVYYFFLYTKTCQAEECFYKALVSCKKAKWINDAEEGTWLYIIKGASGQNCRVEVKLLLAKEGILDIGKIEGKNMDCYLPPEIVAGPEQDLARCTGPLKEGLQNLVIKRMHSYILENLGEISEEMIKPL